MTAWNLSDSSIEKLVGLPETGMGFQLVSASWRGESAVLIVLNAELAFDLSQVELLPGTDPAIILTNGIRVLNLMRQTGATMIGRPEPHSFNLLESRVSGPGIVPLATATTATTSSPSPSQAVSSRMSRFQSSNVFHRYSAYNRTIALIPSPTASCTGTFIRRSRVRGAFCPDWVCRGGPASFAKPKTGLASPPS